MDPQASSAQNADQTQTGVRPGFGESDKTQPASAEAATPPDFGPPAERGEVGTLGPYRIVKQLGHGGMGAVFAALDTRLNRRLALKVMLPEFAADSAARERFLREARAAARIKHDNVVTVYEADERDGVPYIAMEFLEGYPLDEFLKKKGTPSILHILRIGAEAAAGLAAAHKLGLVHRDIKPANLWLEAPHGRVKVLDFGLARPVDAEVELTKSGAIVGTPAFMSPEQARGKKVDHRTDLFSLGGVLYRLCSGRLPFNGATTMAVLMALGTEEPTPVRELKPALPESFAALIHQLLAKNPADRPQTADAVVKRLRAIAQELTAARANPGELSTSRPQVIQPQVVYVPTPGTAQAQTNPFVDIDTSSTEPVAYEPDDPAAPDADPKPTRKPTPKPTRKKPAGRWLWPAVGFAALAALVTAGVIIIIIKNKDGTETKIEVPDGSTVSIGKDGKTVVVTPPGTPPAHDMTSDRKAAEYALSLGGHVKVNGVDREISAAADLPKDPFTLTSLSLSSGRVTDAEVARFKDCKNLTHLSLSSTGVTDAGLANLKDCKNLTHLNLSSKGVTDTGLAHFKDCNSLTFLSLSNMPLTDTGLAHFKDCKNLTQLDLYGTKVTDTGLAHFQDCKSLTHLSLSESGVTDTGLSYFKDCNSLTQLLLSGTPVTDAGLAHFQDCQNLGRLDLSGTGVTDAGLAHFKNCKSLQNLNLSRTGVTDAGLAHFADCKSLTSLSLSSTGVTGTGLAHFKDCKNLTDLSLSFTKVTYAGLAHLKNCKNLTSLDLSGTGVTDAGLAHFKDCKNLTVLEVKMTKMTAKGLDEFHAAVPGCKIDHDGGTIKPKVSADPDRAAAEYALSLGGHVYVNNDNTRMYGNAAAADLPKDPFTLTTLDLSSARVTDADLARFKDCKNLTRLTVHGKGVTDAGLAHFQDCKNLTLLSLSNTGVTDAGLTHFKDCNHLELLNLGGTDVTDAGLAHFKDHKNLTSLDLRGTGVTDAGLAHFKDCKSLRQLNLQSTGVTDAGLAHFKDRKTLVSLSLSNTGVTDAGLAHFKDCYDLSSIYLESTGVTDAGLAHFKNSKRLQSLTLSSTGVTDAGLAHFKHCKTLMFVHVSKTKVTAAGLAEFHAAVPGCKIFHDGGTIEPKK